MHNGGIAEFGKIKRRLQCMSYVAASTAETYSNFQHSCLMSLLTWFKGTQVYIITTTPIDTQ
jgi:hypothetical protein